MSPKVFSLCQLLKLTISRFPSEIFSMLFQLQCRVTWEGRRTTGEGPKAFALVAIDSLFIAENTETNTFMLTGQVVCHLFLMFRLHREIKVNWAPSYLFSLIHSSSSDSQENYKVVSIAFPLTPKMEKLKVRKVSNLPKVTYIGNSQILHWSTGLISKASFRKVKGPECQPALFHSARPSEQCSGEPLQSSLTCLKTQKLSIR